MRKNALANRERILYAAERVFGERGVSGSTEEVAQRANVGIATVFRHFPTKSALIEATLLRHFELLNDKVSQLVEHPEPAMALRDVVQEMIEQGSTKLALISALTDGSLPASTADASSELRAHLGQLLGRVEQAGALREGVTVDVVYLLLRGLAQACATAPPGRDTMHMAMNVVLDGLSSGSRFDG